MAREGDGRGAPGQKRGRARQRSRKGTGAAPVSDVLGASFSALGIAARLREYRVRKLWNECVGAHIAAKSSPERLIGKTLHCKVASPVWATELTYQKPRIIEKLNSLLGEKDAVSSIVFKYGEVEAAPPEPEILPPRELTVEEKKEIEGLVKDIGDPELKAVVRKAIKASKTHV